MYEFDWSSIVPSLPYLLDGLIITLKITVTAYRMGNDPGGHAPVQLRPDCLVCERLRQRIPFHSTGDGTAVVLPDCARLPAKRIGSVAKNRYSLDLGDGRVFDV